jgi:hypothetical protein
MKGLTDLKQFVEKELHARRFLTEALETIKDIEDLDALKKRLAKSIEQDKKDAFDAATELKLVKGDVAKAKQDLANASKQAVDVVQEAKDKAKDIETKANKKAAEIEDEAKAEAQKVKLDTKAKLVELTKLNDACEAALKNLDHIKDEQAKLLKKLEN